MSFYKVVEDGYIIFIGTGACCGDEITCDEYNELLALIKKAPTSEDGYSHRLTVEKEWERFKLPVNEASVTDELSAEEALEIITGGEV